MQFVPSYPKLNVLTSLVTGVIRSFVSSRVETLFFHCTFQNDPNLSNCRLVKYWRTVKYSIHHFSFYLVKPVAPFGDLVLQSVSTALHLNNNSVTGQTASKATILSNPAAFISPDQPLIYLINITDEDITRQEEVVNNARKKIQEVLKA